MKTNKIQKTLVKGFMAVAVVGFTYGIQTPVANAADDISPVIAVHKSKLLPSQFVPKTAHSVASGESDFNKSAIEKRLSSSKMLSSRLLKGMPSQSSASAYSGGHDLKEHASKPHRKF